MHPYLFRVPFTELTIKSYGFFMFLGFFCVVYSIIKYRKLPIRRFLDILAIGLFMALAFRGIGCFLNGCCFGKPTNLPWAVRFPYGSFVYRSQLQPNLQRNRPQPHLQVPDDFFVKADGQRYLKPFSDLTELQKEQVASGQYCALPTHPTQLYSSLIAAINCFFLFLLWKHSRKSKSFLRPGSVFGTMFVLYGTARFFIEFLRDENPFVFGGLTISQIISIIVIGLGLTLIIVFQVCREYKLNDEYKSEVIPVPIAETTDYGNILYQIEKLAEMKSKGILTEEEFRLQKAKLLSQ